MGQNPGYINNIETGKSMPSLSGFFYICDYLGITPSEFFDMDSNNPIKLKSITKDLQKLNDSQLNAISIFIKELIKPLTTDIDTFKKVLNNMIKLNKQHIHINDLLK